MLLQLKERFGSLIKALDILYVIEDVKPVSRIMVEDEIDFSEYGLNSEFSDFKILMHVDRTRHWSDKGIRTGRHDKGKGHLFAYLSKDKAKAIEAKELEKADNHYELGRLLGYPKCCSRFFEKNSEGISKTTNDFTICTFRESNGFSFPWQNNYCLRGFDISLLSHFPCSFSCEESRKLGERNLKIIEKYNADVANYLRHSMKCGIFYSSGVGVFSLRNLSIVGKRVAYSPKSIIPSCRNDFYNLLLRRDRIEVISKNDFKIGEVRVSDNQTFFGIFL